MPSSYQDNTPEFLPTHATTVDEFRNQMHQVVEAMHLTRIRQAVLKSQRNGCPLSGLVHGKYGLALAYKAMDERAVVCGWLKVSDGYRKPIQR